MAIGVRNAVKQSNRRFRNEDYISWSTGNRRCRAGLLDRLELDFHQRVAMDLLGKRNELLTVKEVAAILRVPVSWVYERTRRRGSEQLPYIKMGKYLRFRLPEIEQYLEQLRRA